MAAPRGRWISFSPRRRGRDHGAAVRPRDRPRCHLAATTRRGGRYGARRRGAAPLRRRRGQGQALRRRRTRRAPAGQVRSRDRHHPDPTRRGQDDGDHRPRPGHVAHRALGDREHPSALHGAHIRHQGWGGRRRLQPSRAHGADEPAPDGRLPRGDRRQQHARRPRRQPPLPGQRRGPRPRGDHLAARTRRERPFAAQHRHRPRLAPRRRDTPERLRHHGRLRGDGGPRSGRLPPRPAGTPRPHRGRLQPCRHPRHGRGDRRGRGHGGDPSRRARAEPAPDPGGDPRARPHRAVRQHRHGQLLGGGGPRRHPRQRLSHHRGGLRRRHRGPCPTRPCWWRPSAA